ncbi:hypothetical protein E2C01_031081 [Portunus trituberculatus]|uniref:Uncharacterized protein n=1 Tax=Portunus trituberculatus TaxID=210409 RepID=A0A5B7EZ48_PORTR|nr:hypothetical protein [Portunus trituberculatus]
MKAQTRTAVVQRTHQAHWELEANKKQATTGYHPLNANHQQSREDGMLLQRIRLSHPTHEQLNKGQECAHCQRQNRLPLMYHHLSCAPPHPQQPALDQGNGVNAGRGCEIYSSATYTCLRVLDSVYRAGVRVLLLERPVLDFAVLLPCTYKRFTMHAHHLLVECQSFIDLRNRSLY